LARLIIPLKDHQRRDHDRQVGCEIQSRSVGANSPCASASFHERTQGLVNVLKEKFVQAGGVVTTLKETKRQWDAPNGWAPLQWLTIKGLQNYAQDALAKDIAERWISLNVKVFKETGKLMEKCRNQLIKSWRTIKSCHPVWRSNPRIVSRRRSGKRRHRGLRVLQRNGFASRKTHTRHSSLEIDFVKSSFARSIVTSFAELVYSLKSGSFMSSVPPQALYA
jgi:hypothetical protein